MSKESVQELPHYAPTSLDSANSGVQDHALQEQIAQLKSQVLLQIVTQAETNLVPLCSLVIHDIPISAP